MTSYLSNSILQFDGQTGTDVITILYCNSSYVLLSRARLVSTHHVIKYVPAKTDEYPRLVRRLIEMCSLRLVEDCVISRYNHRARGTCNYRRSAKFQNGCFVFFQRSLQYYSPSSIRRDKTVRQESFALFKEINQFFGICVVYPKTVIHLHIDQ